MHCIVIYCVKEKQTNKNRKKHNDNCYHNINNVRKVYKWCMLTFAVHLFVSNVNSAVSLYKHCKWCKLCKLYEKCLNKKK